MRSKAPLALMEQVVMVLVFALAAALCLQVFVVSNRMSERNKDIDRAVLLAQNTAETLKACGGVEEAAEVMGGEMQQTGQAPIMKSIPFPNTAVWTDWKKRLSKYSDITEMKHCFPSLWHGRR